MGSCKDFYKPSLKWRAAVFVFGLSLFAPVAALQAQEPAQKFLDALRERGYFDVAIHYLDGAGESAAVPEAFRKKVPFEKAQILIDSVGSIRNPDEQEKRLNEADGLLTEYANSVSDPVEATEVKKIQANVRYFRGRNYINQASLDKTKSARKKELFGLANQLLGDAVPKFREVQNAQREQIENFQIDPEDPKSDENLRRLQASYVDTRLKVPVAMEKFALSFGDDQAQRKQKLVEAGNEFEAVAKLYDQRFVQGQMAKAFAARCFQKAGDFARSFELLKEVFDYPTPPKALVREGLVIGIETWPNIEPYPAKDVVEATEQPVMLLSRQEKANPMWLRIQLELARAKHLQSVAVKAEDSALSKQLKRDASRMAREVARKRSPYSQMAADLLAEWGVSVEAAGDEVAKTVTATATSFDDARQKAKDLVSNLSGSLTDLGKAKRNLSTITDAAQKSTEQMKVDQMQKAVNAKADISLSLLSQAVRFADKETNRADLNNIRYLQAYSHFAKGHYLEAAVIGKFLMEKYPTIEWSQQAAGLMVRSYERMFDSANGPAKLSARNNVIKGATAMMELWPDSADSSAAAVSATRVAVLDADFVAAKRFFQKVPEDSPNRPSLASRIGQDVWGQRKLAATDADKMKTTETAKHFLAIAVEDSDPASMNFSTAVSALYYVDACRETGELDQANALVDGVLENLDSNQAIGKSAKFRQAVYNSSLNVYLDSLGSQGDADKWIAKAQSVVERMGAEAAGDSAAQQNVSRVYRKIARDLKTQFESKPNINEKQAFADSLKSFFAGIGSVAKDGKTRLWAGSTLLSIAESLKIEGADAKGKELAAQAIKLLELAKQAGFGDDQGLELSYQHQLALAQRGSGDYATAVKSFEAILEKANGLNFQIDAAKTLFMWGVEANDANALTKSMNGQGQYRDKKTKKTRKRIWGWKTMVGLIRNNEKLREQFRECEYYSVLCRLRYGEIKNSVKAIDSAKGELEKALKRYPDLAVGVWKSRFEQLKKDLDSAKKQLGK
jgi:hypothetical protein